MRAGYLRDLPAVLLPAMLVFFSVSGFALPAQWITLDDTDTQVALAGKYAWYKDESARLSIRDISNPDQASRFTFSEADNLNFGYTSAAIWLKFTIQDLSDHDRNWLLGFDYPLLDQIDVYQAMDDGTWSLRVTGDTFPFTERPVRTRTFAIPLRLEGHGIRTCYIRIVSKSSMLIRPTLQSEQHFFEYESQTQVMFGVMYGFMLMMALYNAFLYTALRDKTYLVYVISVIAGGLYIASLNGHGYQFLWPGSPRLANMALPLASSIWLIATALFTQLFLETRRYTPVFYMLINAMIGIGVVAVVLALFADYQTATRFGTAMALINGILIMITGLLSWYRGNRAARFFSLAWVIYAFGSTTLVLSRFGVIANNAITHHAATLGLLVEIVMLSLALSDKHRMLNRKLEHYTHNLEQKVADRTRELRKVNKELKRLSQVDSLTGLANRREFDRAFNEEWKRHYRNQEPLSLLVCDIDEFKQLNDHFGHDAGDECLRSCAKVIKAVLQRVADHPARIGGDEFAVVLPNTDLAGAAKLADDICEDIHKLDIRHAPQATHDAVTVSVGVASLVPAGENESITLFRMADKALYAAKHQGRDQAAIADAAG
jgi:diguanylate cyclase